MYGAYKYMGDVLGHTGLQGTYRYIGDGLGAYRCMGDVQTYRGFRCMGTYRYMGYTDEWDHTDMWGMYGGIQIYRGHTDVWRVYRCMRQTDVWGFIDIQGAYKCMGDVKMYGVYRCMEDVCEFTDIQGAYRCMGMYRHMGSIQVYEGCTDVWESTVVEIIRTPPYIQTARHNPHMPANYTWVLYFL